jgi:hypothetical protein
VGLGGARVWFVLSLGTSKKKDLKAKYAPTLRLYPTKKTVIIIIIVHFQVIEFRFLKSILNSTSPLEGLLLP